MEDIHKIRNDAFPKTQNLITMETAGVKMEGTSAHAAQSMKGETMKLRNRHLHIFHFSLFICKYPFYRRNRRNGKNFPLP
jgi:hypothetical protein